MRPFTRKFICLLKPVQKQLQRSNYFIRANQATNYSNHIPHGYASITKYSLSFAAITDFVKSKWPLSSTLSHDATTSEKSNETSDSKTDADSKESKGLFCERACMIAMPLYNVFMRYTNIFIYT